MGENKVVSYVIDKTKTQGLDKVTDNGEICYCHKDKVFVVFEETYAHEVGRSVYPLCALAMLNAYGAEYL
jgi:hypothetical protein